MDKRVLNFAAVLLFAVALVSGCTKREMAGMTEDEQVMIAPAVISTINAAPDAGTSAGEGAVSENDELTLYFMRADDPLENRYNGYETEYDATVRIAVRKSGIGKQSLSFTEPGAQYYNVDGTKTLMRGWFPKANDFSNDGYGIVKWFFDGSQDIMVSNFLAGDRTDKGIDGPDNWFEFRHMLAQLQFYVYAESDAAAGAWGKVVSIKVLKQSNECEFDPYSNDTRPDRSTLEDCCKFSGQSDFEAYGIPAEGVAIPVKISSSGDETGTSAAGAMMLEPDQSSFTVEIVTELNGVKTETQVTVPAEGAAIKSDFSAGSSTKVIFKFLTKEVQVLLKPDNWITVSGENVDVDLGVNN